MPDAVLGQTTSTPQAGAQRFDAREHNRRPICKRTPERQRSSLPTNARPDGAKNANKSRPEFRRRSRRLRRAENEAAAPAARVEGDDSLPQTPTFSARPSRGGFGA